jgi:hypothetical protein
LVLVFRLHQSSARIVFHAASETLNLIPSPMPNLTPNLTLNLIPNLIPNLTLN